MSDRGQSSPLDVEIRNRRAANRAVADKLYAVLVEAGLPVHEDIEILLGMLEYLFVSNFNPLQVRRENWRTGRPSVEVVKNE
jgi:hypothetical protein